ncbi:cupin domain-containing protein [Streptomyces litchfieldiae]|uniref:Cupin domain-containing protein n=1 Tax=Streptomyces litchfieldiae TaxID=3075543 RepID=A0ABU2MRR6_9ACTN|nr:cupin domain-containing protein [Streptomyces sp. DSM 44938]MDT0344053.1 cupin domain-containing protein [Streptomyces sp. DSM 44938]
MTPLPPAVTGPGDGFRLTHPKVSERVALPSTATGGASSVLDIVLAPGGLLAPVHTHRHEDETVYVAEGTVGAVLGEREIQAGPGTVLFAPRGVRHTFWNAGTGTTRLAMVIAPGNLDAYFAGIDEAIGSIADPDLNALLKHAEQFGISLDLGSVPDLGRRHRVALD